MDRDSFYAIVIVKVGPSKTPFNMHRGLLCNAAPYFKAAFNGNFTEAKSAVLELPEEDVVIFKRFQLWVYTNKLVLSTSTFKMPFERFSLRMLLIMFRNRIYGLQEDTDSNLSVGLYIFGELRGIPVLQNATIDLLIDKQATENIVPTTLLHRVYENPPENSPLRKPLVDWSSSLGGLDMWFKTSATVDRCPKQFLIDLTVALYLHKKGTKLVVGNFKSVRGSYHVKAAAMASGQT